MRQKTIYSDEEGGIHRGKIGIAVGLQITASFVAIWLLGLMGVMAGSNLGPSFGGRLR
jgi:hypothetical protein